MAPRVLACSSFIYYSQGISKVEPYGARIAMIIEEEDFPLLGDIGKRF